MSQHTNCFLWCGSQARSSLQGSIAPSAPITTISCSVYMAASAACHLRSNQIRWCVGLAGDQCNSLSHRIANKNIVRMRIFYWPSLFSLGTISWEPTDQIWHQIYNFQDCACRFQRALKKNNQLLNRKLSSTLTTGWLKHFLSPPAICLSNLFRSSEQEWSLTACVQPLAQSYSDWGSVAAIGSLMCLFAAHDIKTRCDY